MWRVLYDANIFISYLIRPSGTTAINQVMDLCFSGRVQLVVASELLDEIAQSSATKPYLVDRIEPKAGEQLIVVLNDLAEMVSVNRSAKVSQLRDLDDTYLLWAAEVGDVDFLVTGDRDLLDIRDGIPRPLIVTAAELLAILAREHDS